MDIRYFSANQDKVKQDMRVYHDKYAPKVIEVDLPPEEVSWERVEKLCKRYVKKLEAGEQPSYELCREMAMWLVNVVEDKKNVL